MEDTKYLNSSSKKLFGKKESMRRFLALLVTWGLQIKIIMRNRDAVNRITKKSDYVDSSRGCDRTGILTQIWRLGDIKQHSQ